jgi:hypothetical protein
MNWKPMVLGVLVGFGLPILFGPFGGCAAAGIGLGLMW